MKSPLSLGTAPTAASMAISRPEAIDDAAFTPAAQRRTAAGGFLVSRGMRDPGSPGDLSLGWSRRGRKLPDAVAAKAIEAQPSSARSSQERTRGTQPPGQAPRQLGNPHPAPTKAPSLVAQRPSAAARSAVDRKRVRQAQLRRLPSGSGGRGSKTRASAAPGVAATLFELTERLWWPRSQVGFNRLPSMPASDHARARFTRSGGVAPFRVRDPARKGRNGDSRFERSRRSRPRRVTPVSSLPDLLYLQATRWRWLQ